MAINGSGIRDTGRVLKINKNTVINTLRCKADSIVQVNPKIFELSENGELSIRLEEAYIDAEVDEQWSWVGKKSNQRWLWHAVDHAPIPYLASARMRWVSVIPKNRTQKFKFQNMD